MKKLLFILAITFIFNLLSASPGKKTDKQSNIETTSDTSKIKLSNYGVKDKWLGIDKLHHFYYSASLTGLSYFAIHNMLKLDNNNRNLTRLISGSSVLTLGILKELYDKNHSSTGFSYKDLTFDFMGVLSGILIFTVYSR